MSEQDEDFIEASLDKLCETIVPPATRSHADIRQFISVHEFGLALDLLAYIQLQAHTPATADMLRLFDTLALKLGMTDGDMWKGVAAIRQLLIVPD